MAAQAQLYAKQEHHAHIYWVDATETVLGGCEMACQGAN